MPPQSPPRPQSPSRVQSGGVSQPAVAAAQAPLPTKYAVSSWPFKASPVAIVKSYCAREHARGVFYAPVPELFEEKDDVLLVGAPREERKMSYLVLPSDSLDVFTGRGETFKSASENACLAALLSLRAAGVVLDPVWFE